MPAGTHLAAGFFGPGGCRPEQPCAPLRCQSATDASCQPAADPSEPITAARASPPRRRSRAFSRVRGETAQAGRAAVYCPSLGGTVRPTVPSLIGRGTRPSLSTQPGRTFQPPLPGLADGIVRALSGSAACPNSHAKLHPVRIFTAQTCWFSPQKASPDRFDSVIPISAH